MKVPKTIKVYGKKFAPIGSVPVGRTFYESDCAWILSLDYPPSPRSAEAGNQVVARLLIGLSHAAVVVTAEAPTWQRAIRDLNRSVAELLEELNP